MTSHYLRTLYPQRTTRSWDFAVSGCAWRIRKYLFRNYAPLLRAGKEYPTLQIMLPMVSTLEEVRAVKTLIHAQAKLLGLTAENLPALGIMIEVPAAVMIADKLASEVDFFSIGTNDLTQYIMAADRGNSTVAKLVDYCNDAVINAIAMVCQAGRNNEIPVSNVRRNGWRYPANSTTAHHGD
ncbi:phosphoenolpyruvate-protein phosphoryltransferase PptE [Escherichia coli]|uniref:Phosphoenolpyruvate-protein phosphoryltransferase PptE n=1 Tax=Escherichia coli TaxID=562 RepID=A0A376VXX2_ECOLX|nr:phosphoenolpyruvate-protein phosphoryltransferase PptE [Escherichia coli]